MRTHPRECTGEGCGKKVISDGSQQGLFCYSDETLYTSTFLDVISFTIISTKTSVSAASAVSALHLHCSVAVDVPDTAQSRHEQSKVTEQYSRALIAPPQLFKCVECYSSSGQPYIAIIVDDQTIGIL